VVGCDCGSPNNCIRSRFWDRETGGCSCCCGDSTLLATGSFDQTIRLWHTRSGQGMAALREHTGEIHTLVYVVPVQLVQALQTYQQWAACQSFHLMVVHVLNTALLNLPTVRKEACHAISLGSYYFFGASNVTSGVLKIKRVIAPF
jgi:hypothetical protein